MRSIGVQYLIALLALAAATALRWLLDPALGSHLPYVTYFVAVAFVAWYCGLWPSIFTLVAGWWLADFLWYAPRYEWFPHLTTPLEIAGAATYFMVSGASILVTEAMRAAQRRAETQRQTLGRRENALRESESRKAAILESSLNVIITMDHDGRIVDFNPAAERTFGCTAEQAIGRYLADLIIPARLRDAHWTGLRHFLATGKGPVLGRHIELPALRANGQEFLAELAINAVCLDGQPPFFTGYLRDVTERKQAEEQLRTSLEETKRAAEIKDEFLATLSHELRTPMSAIHGWAQLLKLGMNDEDTKQGLEVIDRNARLQSQIIDDLLDMNRILAGKMRLEIQSVPIGTIVGAAIDAIRPAAEGKGVRPESICDPQICDIRGDATRLQQVVYNLLTNAVKFTPKEGKVQVVCQRVNSHIEISVTDTGQGISAEFLPFMFERFRQQDATMTRTFGGLGLGLSIVKHIVELHGGKVQAASEGEGHGATFTVHLPVAIALKPDLPAGALAREHPFVTQAMPGTANELDAIDTSALKGRTILLVDDEPDARELIRKVLEERGAKCVLASSGEDALNFFQSGTRPDLMISDLGMPKMNGYDLLAKVRSLSPEHGGATPAIALTAFARAQDRTRSLLAGFQLHLSKPVEIREFLASVVSLLD